MRFDRLLDCISSIETTSWKNSHEIIVRFHRDDQKSLHRLGELERFPTVHYFTGDTMQGYNSLCEFTVELMQRAQGEWLWHINDDMTLWAPSWEKHLAAADPEMLLQPVQHMLNESIYNEDHTGPAPCHHRYLAPTVIDELGQGTYQTDIQIWKAIQKVQFIPDAVIRHHWTGHDSTLPK
jgi:hypothetical protein